MDDLTKSINALKKISPELRAEAIDTMRDGAKLVQRQSQVRIGNHPGYGMPSNSGMIGRSVTSKGAGVKLRRSKYPWAGAGEFGAVYARVYGAWRFEAKFKRSIYAPHKPPTSSDLFKNKGGYWIQPTIRKTGRQITRDAQKRILALFERNLPGRSQL